MQVDISANVTAEVLNEASRTSGVMIAAAGLSVVDVGQATCVVDDTRLWLKAVVRRKRIETIRNILD